MVQVNFTLANCTLSLVAGSGHEALVCTLSQFLMSLETRPGAHAFKVSTRAEGFVIEGASGDHHDLVTVLSVERSATGKVSHASAVVAAKMSACGRCQQRKTVMVFPPVEHLLNCCTTFLTLGIYTSL